MSAHCPVCRRRHGDRDGGLCQDCIRAVADVLCKTEKDLKKMTTREVIDAWYAEVEKRSTVGGERKESRSGKRQSKT